MTTGAGREKAGTVWKGRGVERDDQISDRHGGERMKKRQQTDPGTLSSNGS